jgi:hypothetical protein
MKKLEEDSFMYRRLRRMYPDQHVFYVEYTEGTYLDRAYTEYYNYKKELILRENHEWYG